MTEEIVEPDEVDEAETEEAMTPLEKALALASLGIKVFPVNPKSRAPYIPASEGGRGFYDAISDDFEKIATWFTVDYPDAVVGVWTGGSGLLAGDVDRGKKNGKDGFKSLAEAGLDQLSAPVSYTTKSGGEHHIWNTDRSDLTLAKDAVYSPKEGEPVRLEGFDIRAGGSYFIWWGETVPTSRDAFDGDIPAWLLESATEKSEPIKTRTEDGTEVPSGIGFGGSIEEWLEHIDDSPMPSMNVTNLVNRIPAGEFGHEEMVDLAWTLVRLGSERETGIRFALGKLGEAWLREPFNTPKFRRDLENAVNGAINKGGRLQKPVPTISTLASSMARAINAGIGDDLKSLERKFPETGSEIDFARMRREMFRLCARASLTPSTALGIVTGSKAFTRSVVSVSSTWYGDGEPEYNESPAVAAEDEAEPEERVSDEAKLTQMVRDYAADSESFSFLTDAEELFVADPAHAWWGESDYLPWVKSRLKHFNRPYHIGSMFASLSVIASGWGRVPLPGAQPTDCNLYVQVLGDSSSGKSEAWAFGRGLINAYYGKDNSPLIGDAKKSTALSLHRTLIVRDGKPSMVATDEVQSFFEDLKTAKWQGSILGDMSDWYGGEVPPKNTMNDKEISGKSARTMLSAYFTGIADMTLNAIGIGHWRSGLFYRYLWAFGYPRVASDFTFRTETTVASYTTEFEAWAKEFKRVEAEQNMKWGLKRLVLWEEDAMDRMTEFNEQLDKAVKHSAIYDDVMVPSNGRFSTSIAKVATIIAMIEASEKVTLRHALIAIGYAGAWHRSMVLAVAETGKEQFDRDVERTLAWIRRNAIEQIGKPRIIQRSAVMRQFKPNEVADRMLRQLTEEGWLFKVGDVYELAEEA